MIYYHWWKKGIRKIHDIVDEEGNLLDLEQIWNKFNLKIPFTEYHGIVRAIPGKWIDILKEKSELKYKNWYSDLAQLKTMVKTIYRELNYDDLLLKEVVAKWNKQDENYLRLEEYELTKAIERIYQITNYKKLRAFQCKYLCRAIITNIQLVHYKIKSSNRCTLCDIEKETLNHLFWECQCAQNLWKKIEDWIKIKLDYRMISLIQSEALMNPKKVENIIILAGKYFIYANRCLQQNINFVKFQLWISEIKNIEYKIAKRNNKLANHDIKWTHIPFTT